MRDLFIFFDKKVKILKICYSVFDVLYVLDSLRYPPLPSPVPPFPRPPIIGIEEIELPDWVYVIPWGTIIAILLLRLLISLLKRENGLKPDINLAQITVSINGVRIRAIYDSFDPKGRLLWLFFHTHPLLTGSWVILPDGKVVYAYIFRQHPINQAPDLSQITMIEHIELWGSLQNWIRSISTYMPRGFGSGEFPWPMPAELLMWGRFINLTTGQPGKITVHLTYAKYIADGINHPGPAEARRTHIYFNLREYLFFSARLHPRLNEGNIR